MKYKEILKQEITEILQDIINEKLLDIEAGSIYFEITIPELKFGDLSVNVALVASKSLNENPRALSEKFKQKLEDISQVLNIGIRSRESWDPSEIWIEKIDIAGPGFLNFWIKKEFVLKEISHFTKDEKVSEKMEKYVIEHTSPNPNKAMHLGHLRNNLVGMGIGRLLKTLGHEVIFDMVDNDRGIAIAKGMYGLLKYGEEIKKLDLPSDKFAEKLYVLANKDFEENKIVEEEVRSIALKWEEGENRQPEIWKLWREYLSYVYAGQEKTLKRLGNIWDHKWYEHEHYQKGKDLVLAGLEKGIFKKSDGAIITDLEKYKLSDTVLLKQDGTALYMTQDIALTKLKVEKYNTDKLSWVVGPEQSLQMQQLFTICDELGIGKKENFKHISYGYVYLKNEEGKKEKMSSRKGNVFTIDDLIDEVKEKLKEKVGDRVEGKDKDILLEKLALGAIKFSILKVGRAQDIVFDIEESINLHGDSGPYIQYTFARINSLLQKANFTLEDISEIKNENVLEILRFILRYKDVLLECANEMGVQKVAQYILQLSHKFNLFYGNNQIIGSENEREFLFLANTVKNILEHGLGILGIDAPEKM